MIDMPAVIHATAMASVARSAVENSVETRCLPGKWPRSAAAVIAAASPGLDAICASPQADRSLPSTAP
jgi:hypothetical protein